MPNRANTENRCIEPEPGSPNLAVLKGIGFIDSAGSLLAAGIHGIVHLDLRIDAAIEAVVPDRLWEEQQRNGE